MTNPPAIVQPAQSVDFEKLADAIRREENSKTHPYGVMVDGLTDGRVSAMVKSRLWGSVPQVLRKPWRGDTRRGNKTPPVNPPN